MLSQYPIYIVPVTHPQIMSSAPSEVKREQDGGEEVDPLLQHHRGNGNGGSANNSHPMTPPDHQNDVIMKVGRSIGRTMSGPPNVLQTATAEHITGKGAGTYDKGQGRGVS